MQASDDFDGVDFKPFFDMVVGVLFVFLILIGALLLTQSKKQAELDASDAAKRHQAWEMQRASFLKRLAEHLRQRKLDAQVDLANAAVILPLSDIEKYGPRGLPETLSDPVSALGGVLAAELGCVVAGKPHHEDCRDTDTLKLQVLQLKVRFVPATTASPTFPAEQLAQFIGNQLQTSIFQSVPDLLSLSGSAGGVLMSSQSSVGAKVAGPSQTIDGELRLAFDFVPP